MGPLKCFSGQLVGPLLFFLKVPPHPLPPCAFIRQWTFRFYFCGIRPVIGVEHGMKGALPEKVSATCAEIPDGCMLGGPAIGAGFPPTKAAISIWLELLSGLSWYRFQFWNLPGIITELFHLHSIHCNHLCTMSENWHGTCYGTGVRGICVKGQW